MRSKISRVLDEIKSGMSEILDKIYRIIKEKDYSKSESWTDELRDLAPIDKVENFDAYEKALNWAFENEKVKNIALSGPYGSGKSSIIETYLFRNEKVKKSTLKVSLATFTRGVNREQIKKDKNLKMLDIEDQNSKDQEIENEINEDEIEKAILKQLFYKVKPNRIPLSRFRKLRPQRWTDILKAFSVMFILTMLTSTLIVPSISVNLFKVIDRMFVCNAAMTPLARVGEITILSIFIAFLFCLTCGSILPKIHIKEIKVFSNTTIQNVENENESIFNRYLDEIMYFFEMMNYQTVIFEDLDRLNSHKIFENLHELNYLINNDDTVKNKPMRFIYAVNEDIFSAEDRPKFFDFIIPVVPVMNATNSGEVLLHKLNAVKCHGIEHDISQSFVFDIAPFISDMRILQSTYNDFLLYKEMLRDEQRLNLIDQDMFAMMLFKNSYPSEFIDLQKEQGILKRTFENKSILYREKQKELDQKIDECTGNIQQIKSEVCSNISELKHLMLYRIVDEQHLFVQFYDNANSTNLTYDELMNEDYDMEELIKEDFKKVQYRDMRYAPGSKQINSQDLVPFIQRWRSLRVFEKTGLERMQEELGRLKQQKNSLQRESMAALLSSSVLNQEVLSELQENELLLFLLRRGYINEQYVNYINYFKGESLTPEDMNFILSVKTQKPLGKNYRLVRTDSIIDRLQPFEFEEEAARNFDLLEQLLKKDGFYSREFEGERYSKKTNINEKLKKFLKAISIWADSEKSGWEFIDEFIVTRGQKVIIKKFICVLATVWTRMSSYITDNISYSELKIDEEYYECLLSDKKQNSYMRIILFGCDVDVIEEQNISSSFGKDEGVITYYLKRNIDILNELDIRKDFEIEHFEKILDKLKIKFYAIDISEIDNRLINYIFDNRHYELTETMLQTLVAFKNYAMLASFEHSPYSTILALEYAPLIDYVWEEIETFVKNFVLTRSKLADASEDVVDMLKRLNGNTDLRVQVIENEEFELMQIEDCAGEEVRANPETWQPVWDTLLERDVVTVTWENTLSYWEVYHFSKQLKKYVTEHAEILARSDFSAENEAFIKEFINAGFEISALNALLPVLWLKEFDLSISLLDERVLQAMIACRYFAFTADTFEEVSKVDEVSDASNFALEFVLKNQTEFMQIMEDVRITQNLFEQLILNDQFQKKYKDELFTEYAERYMTSKLATKMKVLELPVTNAIFESAWSSVSTKEACEKLLLDYYELLDADELEGHFAKIGGVYEGLTERDRVHDVRIPKTDKTYALAEYLKKIGYITSYKVDSRKVRTITHHELKLRVKKID